MKMTRLLQGVLSVTYHAERCTAGEQTRQRQALGVLLGYEKMAGEGDFNHGLWRDGMLTRVDRTGLP
jgi:hypothetical protein